MVIGIQELIISLILIMLVILPIILLAKSPGLRKAIGFIMIIIGAIFFFVGQK